MYEIIGEREIPGKQEVAHGSNVSVLTSHVGLNPRSKRASLSILASLAALRAGYEREARVIKRKEMHDMANSNRKKASKLQDAKKEKAAEEKAKTAKKAKTAEEKPIKYTVTAKQQADGTFEFCGGKGGFNIIKQKNKALEP